MARKRNDRSFDPGFGSTLGDALRAKGLAPSPSSGTEVEPSSDEATDAPPKATPPGPTEAPPLAGTHKVVVRLERKGRRGKVVTLVQATPPLGTDAAEAVAKELRRALGCGAVVEGDAIAVQGDHRDRLPEVLEDRGARRVVKG